MQTIQKTYDFGAKQNAAVARPELQRQDPHQELRQEQRQEQRSDARATRSMHATANGPIKSFRSGAMQVAIWENETIGEDGQVRSYQTVSFERRYKDKVSGEWKTSNSLRVNDLPKASLILSKAYEYLILTGSEEPEELY